jgi:hypothetical protein
MKNENLHQNNDFKHVTIFTTMFTINMSEYINIQIKCHNQVYTTQFFYNIYKHFLQQVYF